jgi:hypothetical protein
MASDATSYLEVESSSSELAVRQSPAGKDENTEAEHSTLLRAVT